MILDRDLICGWLGRHVLKKKVDVREGPDCGYAGRESCKE